MKILRFAAATLVLNLFLCFPGDSFSRTQDSLAPVPPQSQLVLSDSPHDQDKGPVFFSGDYLEFLDSSQMIKAKGHVQLSYKDLTLTADEMTYAMTAGDVSASGHIVLQEKGSKIYGSSLTYNIKTMNGTLENIRIESFPWFAQGKHIKKTGEKELEIYDGFFTTCELEKPHYRLAAKKIKVVLQDKIEASDVSVYVGDVPILYIPFFSRSLHEDKPPLLIKVGKNDLAGYYLRTTYFYHLSSELGGSVFLDYFSKKGFGHGLGFSYDEPPGLSSSLEAYEIWEQGTGSYRWSLLGSYDQRLTTEDRVVGRFQDYSDGSFDRDYASTFINQLQRSYLAVSKSNPLYNISLGIDQVKTWDPGVSNYQPYQEKLPELDFQLMPRGIGNSAWYYSLASSIGRTRNTLTDRNYVFNQTLSPQIQGGQLVLPGMQWNTGIRVIEDYRDQPQNIFFPGGLTATAYQQGLQGLNGSFKVDNDLTTQHFSFLRSQVGYHYERSFLSADTDPYAGVLQNLAEGSVEFQPGRQWWAKVGESYDFHSLAPAVENKFGPLSLSLAWNSWDRYVNAYFNSHYNFYSQSIEDTREGFVLNGKNKEWQLELGGVFDNIAVPPLVYFDAPSPVLPYQQLQPNVFDLLSRIAFGIPYLGRLAMGQYYSVTSGTFVAQEYSLNFPLHCWEGQLVWRQASERTEVLFSLGLTAFPQLRTAFPTTPLAGSGN